MTQIVNFNARMNLKTFIYVTDKNNVPDNEHELPKVLEQKY